MVCHRQVGSFTSGRSNNPRASRTGSAYLAVGGAIDRLCGGSRLIGWANRLCRRCDAALGLWRVFIVIGCVLGVVPAWAGDGADQTVPVPDFAVIEIKLTPTHQSADILYRKSGRD